MIVRMLRRIKALFVQERAEMQVPEQVDIVATRHGLDPLWVAAIVEVESAGNPWAVRYEPKWRYFIEAQIRGVSHDTEVNQQKTSWGLMQVMGTVARELGCDAPFLSVLCSPVVGLEYGCQYLAKQLKRYDGDILDAVSAYNAGTAKKSADGMYANQSYVDKVKRAYARLTRSVV